MGKAIFISFDYNMRFSIKKNRSKRFCAQKFMELKCPKAETKKTNELPLNRNCQKIIADFCQWKKRDSNRTGIFNWAQVKQCSAELAT